MKEIKSIDLKEIKSIDWLPSIDVQRKKWEPVGCLEREEVRRHSDIYAVLHERNQINRLAPFNRCTEEEMRICGLLRERGGETGDRERSDTGQEEDKSTLSERRRRSPWIRERISGGRSRWAPQQGSHCGRCRLPSIAGLHLRVLVPLLSRAMSQAAKMNTKTSKV
jgi:hypothetical protein